MSTLISPGTTVTVTDESFFIPATATTVPLFFIATQANKVQTDGVTIAAGTAEHSVVRTVTSLGQSVQLYGVPKFLQDASGNQFHGDCRNEYGVMALNQFLSIGSTAYVVRANIDLADASTTFYGFSNVIATTPNFVGGGNGTISGLSVVTPNTVLETITLIATSATSFNVIGDTSGFIGVATVGTAFTSSKVNFLINNGSTPFVVGDYFQFALTYGVFSQSTTGNGTITMSTKSSAGVALPSTVAETWTITFSSSSAFTVTGSVSGASAAGTVGTEYNNGKIRFTITAGSTAFVTGDSIVLKVVQYILANPLGATQAQKRTAIVQALQAEINSNTEVRSDRFEYNLVVCPGYPECVDEMLALSQTMIDEVFVVADTPCNLAPEETAAWGTTSARFHSTSCAYYYPWGLASNLDGTNVLCAASGIALKQIAYSDSVSYVWYAPAGTSRGLVAGVSSVGYVSGTLGTATTFVETNLNQGQRDILYQYYTNINPIVHFNDRGLLVWGQKTSASAASALDRINVVRMLMQLRRSLRKGSFPFIFEPNDQHTRDGLKSMADGILNNIKGLRGLYDFATLCDSSNNSSTVIDNNQMILDVAIKPMKTAEFIIIPIRVLNTGASL